MSPRSFVSWYPWENTNGPTPATAASPRDAQEPDGRIEDRDGTVSRKARKERGRTRAGTRSGRTGRWGRHKLEPGTGDENGDGEDWEDD